MKVGDYVRTKYGITQIKENVCLLDEVIKSSPNIIDLIDVGEYVNGECVIGVDSIEVYTKDGMYLNENIKSILTKERFKSMEYKIGD